MAKKSKPDAAESNAGDDFHVLWTVNKALNLLNFDPLGIKAISVESLSAEDELVLNSEGLLGVDLTEYYGGRSFKESSSVVISQLKYSTRHSTENWTASKICTGRKGGPSGSIIERLAATFKEMSTFGTEDVLKAKLTVKLVSNRPVDVKILKLTNKIKLLIKTHGEAISNYTALKAYLLAVEIKEAEKIYKASKLADGAFLCFLQVLDFSDCSADSSFYQRQKSVRTIANLGSFEAATQFAKLRVLVWDKMLPMAVRQHTLFVEHILYEFGFNDLSDLFPVSYAIEKPPVLVLREQLIGIKTAIVDEQRSLICLHGGAGIGKSTLVGMIPAILPPGSVAITFDCYGGGAYADPDDKRHKPENAYLQLANQLALKTGTQFLLARNLPTDAYIKEFTKRVQLASKILKDISPDALLVIIIDAADNSVTAAKQYHSQSFILEFVQLTLPPRTRIIVSTRTGRKDSLCLPPEVQEIPIAAFSFNESKAFLQTDYPNISDQEIEEFRGLTHSIPRVMSYALDTPGGTLQQKSEPLRPGGKTLEDIFRSRIKEAEKRSGDVDAISRFLTSLVALPRPVPISYVQHISELSDQIIADLKTDLWHGLIAKSDHFIFRDEDFETYLRKVYPSTIEVFKKIADLMLANAATDEYASQHLGTYLKHAGMIDKLVGVVLKREFLTHPVDPIKNKEVFIERARIAMASSNAGNLDFLKLQMVAAEAAKSNKVLEDILINKADLAAAYGNLQTNQKLYFQSGNPGWFGPVHFRSAAIYARKKETEVLAREHLLKGRSWLQYRHYLSEDERESYQITGSDMTFAAEAVLRLEGAKKCVAWISGWQPKSFSYEVAEKLINSLITTNTLKQLSTWLKPQKFRIDIELLIVKIFFEKGLKAPVDLTRILKGIPVLLRLKDKIQPDLKQAVLSFVEYALRNKMDYVSVSPLLDLISDNRPSHVPGFYDGSENRNDVIELDLLFRKGVLKKIFEGGSFVVADFYPQRIRKLIESKEPKDSSRTEEEKKEFDDFYIHFLPVYEMRAEYLLNLVSQEKLNGHITGFLDKLRRDWNLSYRYRHQINRVHRFMSLKLLDLVFYCKDASTLNLFCDGVAEDKTDIDTRLAIVEKLSEKREFFPDTLKLLATIEKEIENKVLAGSEIISHFTRAAVVASRVSDVAGKYFFDKMVLASSEIDLEAHDQLRCVNSIIQTGDQIGVSHLAYSFARYTEYCHERLRGWDDFPWDAAVEGIFKLDHSTAWQVICRWDHRSVRQIRRRLIELLELSYQQKFIDCRIAGALIIDNQAFWPSINKLTKEILNGFDELGSSDLKNTFVSDYFKAYQLNINKESNQVGLDEFYELIADGRYLDQQIVNNIKAYKDSLSSILDTKKTGEQLWRPDPRAGEHLEKWLDVKLKDLKIDLSLDIEKVIRDYRSETEAHHGIERPLILYLKQKVQPGDELVFLDLIHELPAEYLSYYTYEDLISELLKEYDHLPQLKQWRITSFPAILKKWFSRFVLRDYFDIKSLFKLAEIFEIKESTLVNLVITNLPEVLDDLPASVLYQLFELTTKGLEKAELIQLLKWTIFRWEQQLKPDFADGVFNSETSKIYNGAETIAEFLRFGLGHPSKAVRWRTGHSLRKLAKLNQNEILDILVAGQDKKEISGFQDKELTFFWLSAKLYLWITLDQVASDNRQTVLPYAQRAYLELIDEDLPHAQIKFFARSVCLKLINDKPDIFTEPQVEQINSFLNSIRNGKKKDRSGHDGRRNSVPETIRFDFDRMDTLPHWYEPLGRIFDVSANDVAVIADKYISEKWGFTGDVRKLNHVHSNDYGDTMNRHGSETSLEDLRLYYEYHAMFCAAYELLRKLPEVEESYGDSWDEWIIGWGVCWKNFWLADFRDPLPLESRYWLVDRQVENWEYAIEPAYFDEILGLTDGKDNLTVAESTAIHYGKDYETIYLRSGLVRIDTGPSLMKAMQTGSSFNVYLPIQGTDDFYDDEEDETDKPILEKFKVEGWLFDEKNEVEGLDDQDAYFNDIMKIRLKPGARLLESLQLNLTDDFRFTYAASNKAWITKLEVWSSAKHQRSYGAIQSTGYRFRIRKEALLQFLNFENKCLIIECQIKRNVDTRDFRESYPNYNLIYLIYPDGTVATYRGNHSLR